MTKTIIKPNPDELLYEEWLVTNGLGGFASSSICCTPTRKYHSYLFAALPLPLGRSTMLNYIADTVILADRSEIPLSFLRLTDQKELPKEFSSLVEFRLEDGIPFWKYQIGDLVLEKFLFLIHEQNTLHMHYRLLSGNTQIEIQWRPYLHFRAIHEEVNVERVNEPFTVRVSGSHYEIIHPPFPPLRLYHFQEFPFTSDLLKKENVYYGMEEERGYESKGKLISPGFFTIPLKPGEKITFLASTESWETIHILNPEEAFLIERLRRKGLVRGSKFNTPAKTLEKLVLAADHFIMKPTSRTADIVRLQAAGEQIQSIIAGFPWFADWGRDTMISLEGLSLTTGRYGVAESILRTYAHYLQDGLVPNMFPDGEVAALYNTADATLWFFHAADRYIFFTGNDEILELLLPKFLNIIDCHLKGTRFGIRTDQDGLLIQGQQGYALTWMDAKIGDWIVTPRRGKAVEINALWYNALKLLEEWTGKTSEHAAACYESFNRRFWNEKTGSLYDVVDGEKGDDPAIRPNQLFSISLKYPVLTKEKWKPVVDIVQKELVTPYGLRTLNSSHPDFKASYSGDVKARDAAYHQGTVWPWLIGPFIDAYLKVYPDNDASPFLKGLEKQFLHFENMAEIFDASDPHRARGCFSQAWSIAELIRALVKVHPELKAK